MKGVMRSCGGTKRKAASLSLSLSLQIDVIKIEFPSLKRDCTVLTSDSNISFKFFDGSSASLGLKYKRLRIFCGSLSSMFLATRIVEGDISIIRYEGRKQRWMLSNLSLPEILHSKRQDEVKMLKSWNICPLMDFDNKILMYVVRILPAHHAAVIPYWFKPPLEVELTRFANVGVCLILSRFGKSDSVQF